MTEAENRVRQCELDVQRAESREREARRVMELGYERLRAEFETGYAKLREEHQRTLIEVEKERAYLDRAKSIADDDGDTAKF